MCRWGSAQHLAPHMAGRTEAAFALTLLAALADGDAVQPSPSRPAPLQQCASTLPAGTSPTAAVAPLCILSPGRGMLLDTPDAAHGA